MKVNNESCADLQCYFVVVFCEVLTMLSSANLSHQINAICATRNGGG
jgi:hypothetical protein